MDKLLHILAKAADGAFVIDEDQRIVYWNQAAEDILGYTLEDVQNKMCYDILGGCDDDGRPVCCPQCYVSTAALTGEPVPNYDVAIPTKSGETRWLNVSILTLPPPHNESTSLVVHLFRDVTSEKQRQQLIDQILEVSKQLQDISPTGPSLQSVEPSVDDLTDREREVLSLLAQGYSTHDIAQSLSISSSTVRNHVQNILNKLNVHSRLEAVAYAFEHGLVNKG